MNTTFSMAFNKMNDFSMRKYILTAFLTLSFAAGHLNEYTPDRWIETVSWEPRAFVYHGFLTDEECDYLVSQAEPHMSRSAVVDADSGGSKLDAIRTSYGTFLRRGRDNVVSSIEERIALWTKLPVENGEDIQVLRYQDGQKYDAHWDWFDGGSKHDFGPSGNRVATVLMYLSDVEEGGETSFPRGTWVDEAAQKQGSYSPCGSKGVSVRPKKGDALLFWDLDVGAKEGDKYSLHAGCPVLRGTKWSATKWIHVRRFGETHGEPECEDADENCPGWAEAGECEKNPAYMLEACKMSCNKC
uniref:procollagen-proline 4-dioxygenase n=1 Tax=Tetraselmis sp. GSL018 TaxID=582737 RepID=A0A061QZX7_9CHLO